MNLRRLTTIKPYPFLGFFDHSNNSVPPRKQPILARTQSVLAERPSCLKPSRHALLRVFESVPGLYDLRQNGV
ncbi:MAG: hypothetical protein QOJ51_1970 [Acidobacteriaceae bacterium]|jgi:hypothetical protein|nr:hypothetical protein [Acidobacteriaceae bacterium]